MISSILIFLLDFELGEVGRRGRLLKGEMSATHLTDIRREFAVPISYCSSILLLLSCDCDVPPDNQNGFSLNRIRDTLEF